MKQGLLKKISTALITLALSVPAIAVPIDWNGQLGFDMNSIVNVRRTGDECDPTVVGSECVATGDDHARFQSYVLRLKPTLLVNDSVSIFGELSTGAIRGGYLGGDSDWGENGNGSYYALSSSGNNGLVVNQVYAKLYADTALFKVGKFSKHFGTGALLNNGEGAWDRYFTLYDGIEAEFKIGSFKITPVWAKMASDPARPSGQFSSLETGISVVYEDLNSNLEAGVYYGLRETETDNTTYSSNGTSTKAHSTNLIDIYASKSWESVELNLEVPMLKGEVGTAYNNGAENASVDAHAYLLDAKFDLSETWSAKIHLGQVSGDQGSSNNFEGMYLHPNYQIAHIMFRYNHSGFNDATQNPFDSAIVNANFYKLAFNYHAESWDFDMAYIMAKANQTASEGDEFYSHHQRQIATATENQSDDLGQEFDLTFNYHWNPSVTFTSYLAHYQVGSFYEFTNTSENLALSNVTAYGMKLAINF